MVTFCALGEHCSVYDSSAKLSGYCHAAPICQGCKDRSEMELNQLRLDYVDLSQLVPRSQIHSDSQIHRPKPESSPPINVGVFTLRGEIAYVVRLGADALRRDLGSSVPRGLPVREGFGLDTDIRYLVPHVEDLAELGPITACWAMDDPTPIPLTGVQILALFSLLHRRARRVLGLASRVLTIPGSCPRCAVSALRRSDDDAEKVWCNNCQVRISRGDYLDHMKLLVTRRTATTEDAGDNP